MEKAEGEILPGCPKSRVRIWQTEESEQKRDSQKQQGGTFTFHFLLTSVNVNTQGFPCFFTMSVLEPEILSCSLKQVTLRNTKISLPSK